MARPLTRWWSHHTDIIETLINAKKICCFTNSCVGWRRCRCFTGGTFGLALPIVGKLSDYRYLYLMRPPSLLLSAVPPVDRLVCQKPGQSRPSDIDGEIEIDGEININQRPLHTTVPTCSTPSRRQPLVLPPGSLPRRGVFSIAFHFVPIFETTSHVTSWQTGTRASPPVAVG